MNIGLYNAISAFLMTSGIVILNLDRKQSITRLIVLLLGLTLWISLWIGALEYVANVQPSLSRWLFEQVTWPYSTTLLGISVALELSCWVIAMGISATLLHLFRWQKSYRVSTSIISACLMVTLVFPQLQIVESYTSAQNIGEQINSSILLVISQPDTIQNLMLILTGLLGWMSPVVLRI